MNEIRDRNYEFTNERDCGCPTCYRVFTSLEGFDKHRVEGECVVPSEVGLNLDWKGRWTSGSGKKPKASGFFAKGGE